MRKIITLTILVFLFFNIIVYAQLTPPAFPESFYGDLTIDGLSAPAGMVVTAFIDGQERGKITTTVSGKYGGPSGVDKKLIVSGSDADNGKTITFFINAAEADQTATWESGEVLRLDLNTDELSITGGATSGPGGGSSSGGGDSSSVSAVAGTTIPTIQETAGNGDKELEKEVGVKETGLESITGSAVKEQQQNKVIGWIIVAGIVILGLAGYFLFRKKE